MVVEGSSSERRDCRDIEAAVEHISKRPHENFVIYGAPQSVIAEIRRRLGNRFNIKAG